MNIINLNVASHTENLNNIVNLVNWQYVGIYRNKQMEITGSSQMEMPDPNVFVEYEQLTEEMVTEWLYKKINIGQFQENIINQIYVYYFPPQTNISNLPWEPINLPK